MKPFQALVLFVVGLALGLAGVAAHDAFRLPNRSDETRQPQDLGSESLTRRDVRNGPAGGLGRVAQPSPARTRAGCHWLPAGSSNGRHTPIQDKAETRVRTPSGDSFDRRLDQEGRRRYAHPILETAREGARTGVSGRYCGGSRRPTLPASAGAGGDRAHGGMEQLEARWAHNPEVARSNRAPATTSGFRADGRWRMGPEERRRGLLAASGLRGLDRVRALQDRGWLLLVLTPAVALPLATESTPRAANCLASIVGDVLEWPIGIGAAHSSGEARSIRARDTTGARASEEFFHG